MTDTDLSLIAHLMRRAGFGATREELHARAASGYEATVEELLHPEEQEPVNIFDLLRYHPNQWKPGTMNGTGQVRWLYHMINTNAPLQEKMTLLMHQIFATGVSKVDHYDEIVDMIDMFREKALGKYRDLLVAVAKNPAMIFWLDNNENHVESINENWGRELLELFTMGVGNYTETDVREASRAFTGWTITPKLPRYTMGRFDWYFEYDESSHDNGIKQFLGRTGNFNGEDIIDIILEESATAQFIARHLYNFFVADEAQVPAWSVTPPQNPAAIKILADTLTESDYDMRSTLRVLFNSAFFKDAIFQRVKSPTELVVSTLRFIGGTEFPGPELTDFAKQVDYMGQELLNPPSVEGWHTGQEWINSGSLMRRTNFLADMVGDVSRPSINTILNNLKSRGNLSAADFVDTCLEWMGPLKINSDSREELIDHANREGTLNWNPDDSSSSTRRVGEMLQLIVSLRDYQFN